jgi:hypothetical protein
MSGGREHTAREDEKHEFLDWASKSRSMVYQWFELKPTGTVFSDLASKPVLTVSWFGPQNQACFGLSVASQNRWREDDVGHALRFDDLLHLEASRTRVFQSVLRLTDARWLVVHVASLRRSCGVQVEDRWVDVMNCIEPCYPYFIVFIVLVPRNVLVF